MTSPLPLFGVADDWRVKGAKSLTDDDVPHLEIASFEQAFGQKWSTDAHFVTYSPAGVKPGTKFPRCNKVVLPQIRREGYDLERHTFAFDWDTPDHRPWGETMTQPEFMDLFVKACERFSLAANYACLYFTRAGARIVYILDEPMPVDTSEAKLRWMIYRFRAVGLDVDELVDWTRLYRLPMVLRDDIRSEGLDTFDIEFDADARLPVSELGSASRADRATIYADIREFDEPMPQQDEAALLIETFANGKSTATDWAARAKKRLKGRECFDCLFNHTPLATKGSRDQTMHQYVGQAISLLYYMEGTTPQHIFGLFLDPIMQLDDSDGENWVELLWSSVGRLWAKEDAKARANQQIIQEMEDAHDKAAVDILDGMREWCAAEELYGDESDAKLFAERRFIANQGNAYYLIGEDGYYRPQAYLANQLIGAIRTHIPDLIPTIVPTADGKGMKEVQLNTILGRYVTVVDSVVVQPGAPRGFIEGMDTPNARLVVPGFSLNKDLQPEHDPDVAKWLDMLFGDYVDDACRWIAYALAWDEGPICALSIQGEQGAGKKLLVQGLAECLTTPAVATDADITGDYQYGLLSSPFLVVNEGWGPNRGKHPADRFREFTAGDPIQVNRRFMHPVSIRNPMRVIFTANNLDVIKMLCRGRDLSQTDREALAIRLMHFDVGSKASDWLRCRGGMAFTGAPGRRWIAPDAGGRSDYVVAKHFLWLHANRKKLWRPQERFLVEGHGSKELMFEMQTQVGSATLVIETLMAMFENKTAKRDGFVIEKGQVFVLTSAILNYWREIMSDRARGEKLTANSIAAVLGGLCIEDKPPAREIPGHEDQGRRRWHELDILKVREAAARHGFRSKKLEEVCNERIRNQYEEGIGGKK